MRDQPHDFAPLHSLLLEAQRSITDAPDGALEGVGDVIRSALSRVEAETPGGAPLHAQLDNVRKWLDALDRPADHDRFGGTNHLREYVLMQLRLALGALEEYDRETK
jgi:hypothetical protein